MRATGVRLPGENIQQTGHLNFQSGLFPAFTRRGQGWVLPGIHKTDWQGPQPFFGIIGSSDQQHLAVSLDYHSRCYLGVWEEDPITTRADRPDFPHSLFSTQAGATARAIIDIL
jgi:hypothetical protein